MTNLLVTSYENPDLDGTASAFAYAEFLQKRKIDAVAGVFGTPHIEARFVLERFKIKKIENADRIAGRFAGFILVDASDTRGISKKIDPLKVTEIIDHRKINEAEKFPNAKIQIELVGSAATLIAEKFRKDDGDVSSGSAILLASAIVSNTINFKAKVTTPRDIKMYEWLSSKTEIPKNHIRDMFAHKSEISGTIKDVFLKDNFASFEFEGTKVGIVQLEMIGTKKFINNKLTKIRETLGEIKEEKSLDVTFLTCVDAEDGFNIFVAADKKSEKILEGSIHATFRDGIAKRDGVILRKEMVPAIKKFIERN